jgi:hypothetical protein
VEAAFAADHAPPYAVARRDRYRMPRAVASLANDLRYGSPLRSPR